MSIEALVWGLLPAVAALCAAVISVSLAFRARGIFQCAASVVVISGTAWSLLILYRIFLLNRLPIYLPHFVIGLVLVIVVVQLLLFKKKLPTLFNHAMWIVVVPRFSLSVPNPLENHNWLSRAE